MALIVVTSNRFADHVTPPGHPERVERATVMEVVAEQWVTAGGAVLEPRPASDADIERVHDARYVAAIASTRGRPAMLDADTFTSPHSEEVARLAAGAVLTGLDYVLEPVEERRRALAMVRPPGHHAERNRAMGFCLYNNIAIGAAWARHRGLNRVAIVDYDVHHGNGTQHAFYDDPTILFISTHQFPYYPGTGAAAEIGSGEARGRTVNLPLEAGATDADYDLVFREAVLPALDEFQPELVLVSAGFDAHERDPLAGMRLSTDGYVRLTSHLVAAADKLCGGRVVFVTEGGYDVRALRECLEGVMEISSDRRSVDLSAVAAGDRRRGDATLHQVRRVQREFWKALA